VIRDFFETNRRGPVWMSLQSDRPIVYYFRLNRNDSYN
jgi:hypothetical protein